MKTTEQIAADCGREHDIDLLNEILDDRIRFQPGDGNTPHLCDLIGALYRRIEALEEEALAAVRRSEETVGLLVRDNNALGARIQELENDKATLINRLNERDGWIGEAISELEGSATRVEDEYPATHERMQGLAGQLRSVLHREPTTAEAVEKMTT